MFNMIPTESNMFNMIPTEHSGVAHVQQKFTDRNRLAHVEQNSPTIVTRTLLILERQKLSNDLKKT
jgi:hypothetical protein